MRAVVWQRLLECGDNGVSRRWKCGVRRRAEYSFFPSRFIEAAGLREMQASWPEWFALPVDILPDERFLYPSAWFARWAQGRKQLRMEYFYCEMRRRTGLLMDGDEPAGGRWNFDAENRRPAKADLFMPRPPMFAPDAVTREVMTLVEAPFGDHFGALMPFDFAVPEKIAGWLTRTKAATRISHESIYRFIYDQVRRTNDGSWRNYLPRARYKRRRRRRSGRSVGDLMKDRSPIALRPPEVDCRHTFGHWETDLMLFRLPGPAILVSQERKSRTLLLARQTGKAAVPTVQRLPASFQAIHPRLRRTITFDNSTEFAEHLVLTEHLRMRTLFCAPYSSWQKGDVENAIGRLRRFLPRKTNLNTLDDKALHACIAAYNNTPRKCLGFKSPPEILSAQSLHFKLESTGTLRFIQNAS